MPQCALKSFESNCIQAVPLIEHLTEFKALEEEGRRAAFSKYIKRQKVITYTSIRSNDLFSSFCRNASANESLLKMVGQRPAENAKNQARIKTSNAIIIRTATMIGNVIANMTETKRRVGLPNTTATVVVRMRTTKAGATKIIVTRETENSKTVIENATETRIETRIDHAMTARGTVIVVANARTGVGRTGGPHEARLIETGKTRGTQLSMKEVRNTPNAKRENEIEVCIQTVLKRYVLYNRRQMELS